jgi:hypothetical protein
MPATRPIVAQTPSTMVSEAEAEVQHPVPQTGAAPFTLRYDKLVVAVGAYSQSKWFSSHPLEPTHESLSLQCARSQGACALLEGCPGC